jgi:hypothetical protein
MEGQTHRLRGQSEFWALEKPGGLTPPLPTQGSLGEGIGLVPGEAKSEEEAAGIRAVVVAERRTHPPRRVVPRTPTKGVIFGRNRTLLLAAIVALLVL